MSVFKDEKGRWGFSVRYTDVLGNRKQKKSVNKNWTKKQAKIEEEKFLSNATNTAFTFEQLRNIYMTSKELKIKESTYRHKESLYRNYIEQYFKNFDISKIDEYQIESWQKKLLDRGLKLSSIRCIQSELISTLNYGYKRRLIKRKIFVDHIVSDAPKTIEKKFITKNEFDAICDVALRKNRRNLYIVIQCLYYTGMRIGELLALTNNDINGNVITISKTYNHVLNKVTTTKNNTIRNVTVSDRIIDMLNEKKQHYRDCGIKGNFYIFGGNKPSSRTYFYNEYRKICDELHITPSKLHTLRHTHVSNLIALGFNPFEISERTGHSVEMIHKIYGHVIDNPQVNMANKLETL